jgi:LmbE family N-acetylglucosaminyl deacetylase
MQKLEIWQSDRILVLAPHPDDESIWCWWLILKYHQQCDVIVLTDGRYGWFDSENIKSVIKQRSLELENAMRYAGIKNRKNLEIEDTKLSDNFEKFTTLKINDYDSIFCPTPSESHPDHACIYPFLSKLDYNAKIFGYEVWSALSMPSHYLDISNIIKEKEKLINFYTSQVTQVDYASRALAINHFRGLLSYPAIKYAEAYQQLK